MQIQPMDATLGAYVYDVKLTKLTQNEWLEIQAAFLEYAVLIFPQANLNTASHIDFGERFGTAERFTDDPSIKMLYVTNVDPAGNILPLDDENFRIVRGNEQWHTDSSYMDRAAKASTLCALTLPKDGGETQWTDMRAAYDSLDELTKQRIERLSAFHSYYHSQKTLGHVVEVGSNYGFHRKGAPLRPLVKVHPETGRKSLFVGRHAYRIPGLPDREAQDLLAELMAFACQSPRIVEHSWSLGDLALWDNRCLLHRVRPYDYTKPRIMRHVRISGDESECVPLDPAEQPEHFSPKEN